jgi:hypothetical protein
LTELKWGWYDGYLLVVAIDISATIIPIVGIAIREMKELRQIKVDDVIIKE